MAACTPALDFSAIWQLFRKRLVDVVRVSNCEAGEAIWSITEDAAAPGRLVLAACDGGARLELCADCVRGTVACALRRAGGDERWSFHVENAGKLRRQRTLYGIDEAVNAVLDRLVS